MSTHCAITGCSNGDYRLMKWRKSQCDIHAGSTKGDCPCEQPFKLFTFPGKVKDPERRSVWKNLVNRLDKDRKLWSPKSKSRVCSDHFDGEFPYPVKNLGYPGADAKVQRLFPERYSKRRRLDYNVAAASVETPAVSESLSEEPQIPLRDECIVDFEPGQMTSEEQFYKLQNLEEELQTLQDKNNALKEEVNEMKKTTELIEAKSKKVSKELKKTLKILGKFKEHTKALKATNSKLAQCKCRKPLSEVLLTIDENALFYTGCETVKSFDQILSITKPFLSKKWQGKKRTSTGISRKLKKQPSKLGRKPKLTSRDELLMTLIKLRLGLTEKDLAQRFGTSVTHVSNTFITWCRLLASVLKPMIFVPNQGQLNFTRPKRFDPVKEVSQIIDCFECFIETPKSPDLQKLTWSEYKHHNTVKVLVGCSPNSAITFISDSYPGSISDKAIVKHSDFLDSMEMYSAVMADKGFNIEQECLAHNVRLIIPPGKRGAYQMTPHDIKKTKLVAQLRILIEQAIRNMKGFKFLSTEIPITLLPIMDDVVTVCGALVNLRKPIMT